MTSLTKVTFTLALSTSMFLSTHFKRSKRTILSPVLLFVLSLSTEPLDTFHSFNLVLTFLDNPISKRLQRLPSMAF